MPWYPPLNQKSMIFFRESYKNRRDVWKMSKVSWKCKKSMQVPWSSWWPARCPWWCWWLRAVYRCGHCHCTARCTPPPVECQPPSGTQPPRTTSYNTTVAVTHNISCSRWSLFGKRQKNICDYWISWLLSRWRGELWRWWHRQEACPCDAGDTVIMPAQPDQAEWGGLNIILLLPQWRSRISHQLSISLLRGPCPTAQSR